MAEMAKSLELAQSYKKILYYAWNVMVYSSGQAT